MPIRDATRAAVATTRISAIPSLDGNDLRPTAALPSEPPFEDRQRPRVLAEPIKRRDPGVVGELARAFPQMDRPLTSMFPA
jgi:hypothetical protein